MSVAAPHISGEQNTGNDNALVPYNPLEEYPNFALQYISTMFVNVQQLKSDLRAEIKNEKHELVVLNDRLVHFLDGVQQLEIQNAKYAKALVNFRQTAFISAYDTEWNRRYVQLQADLIAVNYKKTDYSFEFELFQLQSEIYKELIRIVEQSSGDQNLKLKEELEQTSSALINLRGSYKELQKQIGSLKVERENTFQQYLKMANTWGHSKKQINQLTVSIQILKKQQAFYMNVRSTWTSGSDSAGAFDMKQFWAMKWEKIVTNVRHDYELLYATIHRETAAYYEKKMEEIQVEVEQGLIEQANQYQEEERRRIELLHQTLYLENEEARKMHAYEDQLRKKFEALLAKLDTEFQSVQHYYSERLEEQSKSLQGSQERVITLVESIEEMRQKKRSLESEIVIYRRLLEVDVEVSVHTPSLQTVTTTTYLIERRQKSSIGIECPLDNTYICLTNESKTKDVNISRWMVKRRVDSKTELKYTLPNNSRLPPGGEIRIYSTLGADAAQFKTNYDEISRPLLQEVVGYNISSWVIGGKIETTLYDDYGEEKASYTQTADASESVYD